MNISEYIPIAHFKNGYIYSQVFMILECYTVKKPSQKTFTKITLQDVTGKIEGAIWDCSIEQHPDILQPGNFVYLEISTVNFRGNLQFNSNMQKLQPFNGTPDNVTDYIRGPNNNVLDALSSDLNEVIDRIDDNIYRDVIGNAINSLELVSKLRNSPYGIEGPLAYRGGLLIHTYDSLEIALNAAKKCTANKSLIIAGGILRNIGWSTITIFQGNHVKPRDAYYMTGIHRASARFIDHLFLNTESAMQITIPEPKKQALENMCNIEANIRTLEGKIVSNANAMADTLNFGEFCLQRKSNQPNWQPDHQGFFTGHM
jgi:hypothetical protein